MLPGNFLNFARDTKSAASDRGAVGDRVVYAVCARAMRKRRGSPVRYAGLERQEYVEDLLAIAALLHIGNLAAASVRNTCLRDLVRIDCVVALDVFRSHNSGDDEFANLEVDANFL